MGWGVTLCHTQGTGQHGPLQMLGPENEVRNYLALEKINDILGFELFRHLN